MTFKERYQFIPFWKVTDWGFLSDAFAPKPACDEWHNKSFYLVIPLVGNFIWFPKKDFSREGEVHLWAHGPEGWQGEDVASCDICKEIKEDIKNGI